jgi:hypothetical protein
MTIVSIITIKEIITRDEVLYGKRRRTTKRHLQIIKSLILLLNVLLLAATTIVISASFLLVDITPSFSATTITSYPKNTNTLTVATNPTVQFQSGTQGSSSITNNGVTATVTISAIPKNNGFESTGTWTASGGSGAVVQDSSTAKVGSFSGKTDSRAITTTPTLTQSSLNLPISSISNEAGSFSFYIRNGGSGTLGYNVAEIIFTSTGGNNLHYYFRFNGGTLPSNTASAHYIDMGSGITNYPVNTWVQQSRNLYSDWVTTSGFSSSDTMSQIQLISRSAGGLGQNSQLLNWDELYIKQLLNYVLAINNAGSTSWQAQMVYDSSSSTNIARIQSLAMDISTTSSQQIVVQAGSVTTQSGSLTTLTQSGNTPIIATSFSASSPGSSTVKINVIIKAQGVTTTYPLTLSIT